jgi:hypothetical protein
VVRAAAVRTLVRSSLRLGEQGNGGGDECGVEGWAPRPFIGSEGDGGKRAAAVVRHNGMKAAISEGNRPEWWWGVMRSRCSSRYESGGGVRTRETAAAAVGPGRKTTGRGPHINEGGEGKAGWADRRPLGRLAGGLVRERGEVGRGWVKNRKWAKVQNEILFEIQFILEIWQKFGKLHKEI